LCTDVASITSLPSPPNTVIEPVTTYVPCNSCPNQTAMRLPRTRSRRIRSSPAVPTTTRSTFDGSFGAGLCVTPAATTDTVASASPPLPSRTA
jgi:hypothetical protein